MITGDMHAVSFELLSLIGSRFHGWNIIPPMAFEFVTQPYLAKNHDSNCSRMMRFPWNWLKSPGGNDEVTQGGQDGAAAPRDEDSNDERFESDRGRNRDNCA